MPEAFFFFAIDAIYRAAAWHVVQLNVQIVLAITYHWRCVLPMLCGADPASCTGFLSSACRKRAVDFVGKPGQWRSTCTTPSQSSCVLITTHRLIRRWVYRRLSRGGQVRQTPPPKLPWAQSAGISLLQLQAVGATGSRSSGLDRFFRDFILRRAPGSTLEPRHGLPAARVQRTADVLVSSGTRASAGRPKLVLTW